jgi:hypothetical protein
VSITAGQPVGVAAGDYLLTVDGLTAPSRVEGQIYQLMGGTGVPARNADVEAGPVPGPVTATVRVSSPSDVFNLSTPGVAATWTSMTLTATTWSYLVRGQAITSRTDPHVIWHGVNSNPAMLDSDYANLHQSFPHDRIVRTTINEECWDPFFTAAQTRPGCNSQLYRSHIQAAVAATIANSMVALIDIRDSGRDNPNYIPPSGADVIAPDQHTLSVWKDLAGLYANNPNVIFETFNEPTIKPGTTYPPANLDGGVLWRTGGPITMGGITWQAPGVQQIVDQIRAAGAYNLTMIEGASWGGNLTPVETRPVHGTNLAYSFHAYAGYSTVYPSSLDTQVAPLLDPNRPYRYAGYLTEFGTTNQDLFPLMNGSNYLRSVINWANGHGVGWAAWGWFPHTYDSWGTLQSYNPLQLTSRADTIVSNL